MKGIKIFIGICCVLIVLAFVICGLDTMTGFMDLDPSKEELLTHVPEMDAGSLNRFIFKLDMTGFGPAGDNTEINMSGTLETYGNVSHIYNLDIDNGEQLSAETWADLSTGERYTDLGEGFIIDDIDSFNVISDLENAINNRNGSIDLTTTDTTYILSWKFPIDSEYLFGEFLRPHTNRKDFTGSGLVTAVLDKETFEFQYFTVVVSANTPDRAGAVIDSVFYWEVRNDDSMLRIPSDVSLGAYQSSTGVISDKGYDEIVNPIAEELMKAYGGMAEVNHYNGGTSLFWTLEQNDMSATVNYVRTNEPGTIYAENYDFLLSFYGSSAEETNDGAYFYDSTAGELIYTASGNDWYAEIIITGNSDNTQGNLRKSLITYKAKLGI